MVFVINHEVSGAMRVVRMRTTSFLICTLRCKLFAIKLSYSSSIMRLVRQCNARCENGDYYYYDYEHDCEGDCDYGGECAGNVEMWE